jgi:hypothetical protein
MYHYSISGLHFESNVPLLLRQVGSREGTVPDVTFTLKTSGLDSEAIFSSAVRIGDIRNGAGHPSISVSQLNGEYLLDCLNSHKRIRFVMPRDGRWIDCYTEAGSRTEDIELWLFGLVLSFILQARGMFSLHAAAVNCHGQAVAFLGTNGHGKTTLALFFLRKSHSLITDDVLPLVQRDAEFLALPASPTMNLWSTTLSALASVNGSFNGVATLEKRRHSLDELNLPFCPAPVRLTHIYFLKRIPGKGTDSVDIVPVSHASGLIELLGYTRANSMIEPKRQKTLLMTYGQLISQVSVRLLSYPAGFEFLPAVYDKVLEDITTPSVSKRETGGLRNQVMTDERVI